MNDTKHNIDTIHHLRDGNMRQRCQLGPRQRGGPRYLMTCLTPAGKEERALLNKSTRRGNNKLEVAEPECWISYYGYCIFSKASQYSSCEIRKLFIPSHFLQPQFPGTDYLRATLPGYGQNYVTVLEQVLWHTSPSYFSCLSHKIAVISAQECFMCQKFF